MDRGTGSKLYAHSLNFRIAVQSKVYSCPAGCSQLWLCMLRPLYTEQWPDLQWLLSVLKFEIWCWWYLLSTMMNNLNLVCRRWKSFLFNSLYHHKLQGRHIRSRLMWVSKECTFHWRIDCGKYHWPICWGRKLLGWPSYAQSFPRRMA